MAAGHQHQGYATRAELRELRQEVARLRADVRDLATIVRMMHTLQTAARALLGIDPKQPGEE